MARILKYIYILAGSLLLSLTATAKTSKYRVEKEIPKAKLINGFGVGIDGVGLIMKVAGGRFANMEVMGRLNLLEKYFPIAELGIGDCSRKGNEQNTQFHTRAPYFRVGADYCLTKKRNGNRLLLGLRYGFSSFKYDYSNPDFADEVYGVAKPAEFEGLAGNLHWLEACAGAETRLWTIIRLGFTIRYKMRLHSDFSEHGDPWFVPGFGKNGSSAWGGSVNLMFDI